MNPVNRRLVIALALSAALNIFLAGFVAARLVYRGGHGRDAPAFAPHDRTRPNERMGRPGPMKRIFHEHANQLAPKRKALRKARKNVARSLGAEPFQPESLRAALDELRQATVESQQVLHSALVKAAAKATPVQRRALSRSRFLQHPDGKPPLRKRR